MKYLSNFLEPLMKLFLIKSNKDKCKVAQRILSFKKKTRLKIVMNMYSKLLNNHSLHPPLFSVWGCGGGGVNVQPNFRKGGGLDRTSTFRGGLLENRGVTLFEGEV